MAQAPALDKRRMILDAAIRVSPARASTTAASRTLPTRRGSRTGSSTTTQVQGPGPERALHRALVAAPRGDRGGRRPGHPGARQARRRRGLHRRPLPPRPRADEGDHRRGHTRRELVRPQPPAEIRRAYDKIAKIVADGQKRGEFRSDVDPEFAAMWFDGAIEQLLSGWVFDHPHRRRRLRARQGDGRRDDLRRASSRACPGGDGAARRRLPWESAATTRRQDRVLHGVAKIVNVIVGALIFPVWLAAARWTVPAPARTRRPRTPTPCRSPPRASARWMR